MHQDKSLAMISTPLVPRTKGRVFVEDMLTELSAHMPEACSKQLRTCVLRTYLQAVLYNAIELVLQKIQRRRDWKILIGR